jgi:polysaccharide biosynthesis protein PslH
MRILLLTNKMPYPARDGGSIATLTLAKALHKVGNTIHILSMNTSKHFVNTSDIPQNLVEEFNFETVPLNTSISVTEMLKNFLFKRIPYNAERFINDDFETKLIKLLTDYKFDIVQLEGLYLCPYIKTIRHHSKALISLRAHNIEHEIWERTVFNEQSVLKRLYLKNLAKRIKKFEIGFMDQYDLLIPITERDALRYKNMGSNLPAHVVPTGVDSENYKKQDNNNWPGVFHIGALDWIPNQEGLLWFLNKVWPLIRKEHPNLEFIIAGRNAPNNFLSKIKQDGVVYVGEVENAIDFMNENNIMIVPLLSGSGMRIKIIEGMALGKVIITTSIGTEGIDTSNNENILICNTPDMFAHQLNRLLTDKQFFNSLSKNAIKFVTENYNNQAIANKLTNFYESQIG